MLNQKTEENIMIAINSMEKIIAIFLGPFLTTYFIKTSQESIVDISIYYIFSYLLIAISSFIVASIIKNKFRIGMFRVGILLNFVYILTIIFLKDNILNHLPLIAILCGVSSSAYWFPYNLFIINKIDNNYRTEYTVKSKVITSIISVLCPILLGSIITVSNYELTAIIILFISLLQIILSFMLKLDSNSCLTKFDLKKTWDKLKNNKQIRKTFVVEFIFGLSISDGALQILITILIFNSFKTNLNLGIITSLATILSLLFIRWYGKKYKTKNDKLLIIISSFIPVLSLLLLFFWRNNISLIIYDICYVIFASLLTTTREIRVFNIADSYIVNKDIQNEFLSIREGILNCGRIIGYFILLIAGIIGNQIILDIVLILLTLSILLMGINISKIEKFEENKGVK